jgi:hypothetical protein
MGCPPAPPWENKFYALCEALFVPIYQENLALYRSFIDNVKGIWTITNLDSNDATWESFKAAMNNPDFTLEWIVSPPSQVVDFMDLTFSIKEYKIITTLYKKPSNFHLYIPHPFATLLDSSEEWYTVWSTACTHLYQTKMTLELGPSPPFATSSDADTNHAIYILCVQVPSQEQ